MQAVPSVIGVVAGQLAPMFQGTRSKADAEAMIAQLLQVAASNGLVGRAEPVAGGAGASDEVDPRFAEADAALERGDFAAAVIEYDKLLAQFPNDAEAKAGRAQVALLARSSGGDPAAVLARAASDPADVEVAAAFAAFLDEPLWRELIETKRVSPAYAKEISAHLRAAKKAKG